MARFLVIHTFASSGILDGVRSIIRFLVAKDVSTLPPPNPPGKFPCSGLSRSQLSAFRITPEFVSLVRFQSFTLRSVRTSSDLLLPFYKRNVDSLASFPVYTAFLCSKYYDASDTCIRHRWTAHLRILM